MTRFALLVVAFLLLIFWLDPYAPPVSLSGVSGLLGDDPVVLGRRPYPPDERLRFDSLATVDLSAEVAFANQPLRYDLQEEEVLELTVLAGEPTRARLAFPLRRTTTVAPLLGRKVKQRRVEGKTYLVTPGDDGPAISDPDGDPTREKEARYVRWAWEVVGGDPPLHALLPAEGLQPGQTLTARGEAAKRLLGLGLEEVRVEQLELTLVGPPADGQARFQARAQLAGSAEVGGQDLSLEAELTGELIADAASAWLVRVELSGDARIASDGGPDDTWQARGSGPLTIRRSLSRAP